MIEDALRSMLARSHHGDKLASKTSAQALSFKERGGLMLGVNLIQTGIYSMSWSAAAAGEAALMILPDVNVLVQAWRPNADRHREYRDWLSRLGWRIDGLWWDCLSH